MAQSRRRERALARRRFERRRMAEMQRRAERRRRNNRIGAIVGVVAVLGLVIGLAVGLSGGSGKTKTNAGSKLQSSTSVPTLTPSPSVSPSASTPKVPNPTTVVAKATKTCAPVKPNPPASGEPRFRNVTKVPSTLQVIDLKAGHGAPVKAGQSITVKYVGVGCSSGKFFDASYTDGAANQQFSFTLGKGSVIPGWDQGLVGMKVGGVRELVIPAKLAYAAQGAPPSIAKNAPLLFVVTLDKVGA